MSRFKQSFYQRVYVSADFDALKYWPKGFSLCIMKALWEAFQNLQSRYGNLSDFIDKDTLQPERTLTREHALALNRLSLNTIWIVEHEADEFETASSDASKPPSYDIGFTLRFGRTDIIWPCEAKMLWTSNSLAAYFSDLEKYCSCVGAPFTPAGAIVGYLVEGNPEDFFEAFSKSYNILLNSEDCYSGLSLRHSDHTRQIPANKNYVEDFRCHHLVCSLKVEDSTIPLVSEVHTEEEVQE